MPKALFVLTSHATLGNTGRKTGWFLEEAAVPYMILHDAGYDIDIASIAGGAAPVDPSSQPKPGEATAPVARFLADPKIAAKLEHTRPIAEVDEHAYDLVFLPGGHGTMWDFPVCEPLARVIQTVYFNGGVVGAVCHGPAGLVEVMGRDGKPLITGRRVNGFTNEEESAVGLTDEVPFLLEDQIKAAGGVFEKGPKFTPYAVRDGRLVTGQNPMSAELVARALLEAAREAEAA
jgi:putative intracellular protease/amidase